jgi:hypothetical protein
MRDIAEADWKKFRHVHKLALDRFCQRVLDDVGRLTAESNKSNHERYLAIYALVRQRDSELASRFNDVRRSTALMMLTLLRKDGLITDEEFAQFSEDTRARVENTLGLNARRGRRVQSD